ncbi:MAG: hypothetical protein HUU16_20150, partial [Candidatus Omnitrophica bacterium]|nr:hypothetical protein [Candidatus Omnitrophota bacterium]
MRFPLVVPLLVACLSHASALSLEEVDNWKADHGEGEIRAALSKFNPNEVSTLRLLDLCLHEFLSRRQIHLFNKWSEELLTEETLAALDALVCRGEVRAAKTFDLPTEPDVSILGVE